ncbi:MAG: DUF2780 domain-containing protein [Symploca sp. SIO2E9]|nr:DUF2780 domain-containing protein [Symploca sp. SIO2E9]
MELIQLLTQNLGVQESQAMGGAGLIFQLAKEKLGEDTFSTVAQYVPGIGDMLQEAPQAGGMLGALGGLASAMGGEAAGIGNLVSLAGGFSQLGLDGGMVGQFVPIILSYLQNQGGDEVTSLLENILS